MAIVHIDDMYPVIWTKIHCLLASAPVALAFVEAAAVTKARVN